MNSLINFRFIALFVTLGILTLGQTTLAHPTESANINTESTSSRKYFLVNTDPFVPQKVDYIAELGSMWEESNLYWIGANIGFHTGTCFLSSSQSCQQYVDVIGGVGGRDSQTHTLIMGSVRWQWVNFPSSWSPMARIFSGALNSHESGGVSQHFLYGAGFGVSTYLHERADLRLEARIGHGEQIFAQAFFGIHIKMNKWVMYFAKRLKGIGLGTYEGVKKGVKKAGKVVSEPFLPTKKEEPKEEPKE